MALSRYDVLRAYVLSKERSTVVGLRLTGRPNLLITVIDEVAGDTEADTTLVVGQQSIYGEPIADRTISIREIENICNLRIHFNDPFYVYLRSLRNNIRSIRSEAGFREASLMP